MTTQRTPDEMSSENALICEKLLGLTKHCDAASCPDWRTADGKRFWSNPTFDNWSDAGLILDALADRGFSFDLSHTQTESGLMQFGVVVWFPGKRYTVDADSLLIAIRAAAAEYAKAVKS